MQRKVRTHYDNLKVSRNAPPEVVAAAYRALSKRLHPDMNKGSAEAGRAMQIVNESYRVLSDPIRRLAHDEWIAAQEAGREETVGNFSSAEATKIETSVDFASKLSNHIDRMAGWYILAGIVGLIAWASSGSSPSPSGLPTYDANPVPAASAPLPRSSYSRPATAPNGKVWPTQAAYIAGYPIAHADGLSKLTIDNSANATDMFVKLVAVDAAKTYPVRHAFIPANQSLTMNKVRAGRYDVRYMDLSDGSLSRSETFELSEFPDATGTQYSVTRMTLYKIQNGNMQTYDLDPNEF